MKSLFLIAIVTALAGPAVAAEPSAAKPVAVVVNIQTPTGLTREQVVAEMEKSISRYKAIPGLVAKYYTLSDDGKFGGIYLWRSRSDAQAWFSEAWRTKATQTYGTTPQVMYFDTPFVIDGAATIPKAS